MYWQYAVTGIGTWGLALAAVLAGLSTTRHRPWARRTSLISAGLILGLNALAVAVAMIRKGPVRAMGSGFESALLLAGLLSLVALIGYGVRHLRGLEALLLGLAALVQLGAAFEIGRPGPDIPYRSWFVSHQLAFIVAAACFFAAGSAGAVYLGTAGLLRRRQLELLGRFPPLETLERVGRWSMVVGFPCLTYGVLTGFCQIAHQRDSAARAWLTDPFIAYMIVLWGVYALAVSAIWFKPRMRGRRGAAFATAGLVLVAIAFLVVERFSSMHP